MDKTLLDGITAIADGEWISAEALEGKTIHVKGISTATLHICGSCDPAKPANGVHEIQIGDDITADCLVGVREMVKWLKVRCSAWTAGTISAFLTAREIESY